MKKIVFFLFASVAALSAQAGHYIEFKMKSEAVSGLLKSWNQDGNNRSQMMMDLPIDGSLLPPGIPNPRNMVLLSLKSQPGKIFLLNEMAKTYSEGPASRNFDNKGEDEKYEITIVGKETVNGYNCTHLKSIRKDAGQTVAMEWWVSQDVKGYKELFDVRTRQFSTEGLYKSMKEKNVEGFPVKIRVLSGNKNQMEMELVKVEQLDIPESMFSLEGLTKAELNPLMQGGMDMEKLKNMSPEDRQKFFQEMKKLRGNPAGLE